MHRAAIRAHLHGGSVLDFPWSRRAFGARVLAIVRDDARAALEAVKKAASFGGPMRNNLCAMLDYFRIHELLKIDSCGELFTEHSHLVHFTSLLRYPVLRGGCDYSAAPDMIRNTFLHGYLLEYFAREAQMLKQAIFVPLGPKVSRVLSYLAGRGVLDPDRVLDGLQNPSGANAERIAYLLDRKTSAKNARTPRGVLSGFSVNRRVTGFRNRYPSSPFETLFITILSPRSHN